MTRRTDTVPEEPPDYLTVDELAAILRISRNRAYELVRLGVATSGRDGIAAVRVDKQFRISRYVIEERLGGPTHLADSRLPRRRRHRTCNASATDRHQATRRSIRTSTRDADPSHALEVARLQAEHSASALPSVGRHATTPPVPTQRHFNDRRVHRRLGECRMTVRVTTLKGPAPAPTTSSSSRTTTSTPASHEAGGSARARRCSA